MRSRGYCARREAKTDALEIHPTLYLSVADRHITILYVDCFASALQHGRPPDRRPSRRQGQQIEVRLFHNRPASFVILGDHKLAVDELAVQPVLHDGGSLLQMCLTQALTTTINTRVRRYYPSNRIIQTVTSKAACMPLSLLLLLALLELGN